MLRKNGDPTEPSATSEQPDAGWYTCEGDPPEVLRWWDGAAWTEHTTPSAAQAPAAPQAIAPKRGPAPVAPVLARAAAVTVIAVVVLSWLGPRAAWAVYVLAAGAVLALGVLVLRIVRAPFAPRTLAMLGAALLVCVATATVTSFLLD